jgi:hypothetical protein
MQDQLEDLSELRLIVTDSDWGYGAALTEDGGPAAPGWEIRTPWRLIARRIAACVNYCAGLSTEELERRVSDRPPLE